MNVQVQNFGQMSLCSSTAAWQCVRYIVKSAPSGDVLLGTGRRGMWMGNCSGTFDLSATYADKPLSVSVDDATDQRGRQWPCTLASSAALTQCNSQEPAKAVAGICS